jgi:hypothetical protein
MQLLFSHPLSHTTKLRLSKAIENKMKIKSARRGSFIYLGSIGKIYVISI